MAFSPFFSHHLEHLDVEKLLSRPARRSCVICDRQPAERAIVLDAGDRRFYAATLCPSCAQDPETSFAELDARAQR